MNECQFCHKTRGLFSLELKGDDGEKYTRLVCGTCWNAIVRISQNVTTQRLENIKLEERLTALEQRVQALEDVNQARLTARDAEEYRAGNQTH